MIDYDQVQVSERGGEILVTVLPCGIVVRAPDASSALDLVLGRIAQVRTELVDEVDGSGQSSPEFWQGLEHEVRQKLSGFVSDTQMGSAGASARPQPTSGQVVGGSQSSMIATVLIAALAPWCIVALLLVVLLAPLASTLSAVLGNVAQLQAAIKGDVSGVGNEGATWLVRVGDTVSQITPERRAQLREATHKIVDFLAPIVAETRPLFSQPSEPSARHEPVSIRTAPGSLSAPAGSAGGSGQPAVLNAPESR